MSDLGIATRLLALTHASYGLGEKLMSLDPEEAVARIELDPILAAIEADLQRLYARAGILVQENRGKIERLAAALIVRRFMTGEEVLALLEPVRTANPTRTPDPGGPQ